MGMTPLEGLMMGTRAGSIDPGIIFRLLLDRRVRAPSIEADLDRRSGLVGDRRDGRHGARCSSEKPAGDERRPSRSRCSCDGPRPGSPRRRPHLRVGSMRVVFTGGIGEHARSVTDRIRDRLHLVGEPGAGVTEGGDSIARSADGPAILHITSREDLVIADAVVAIVGGG